jgi:hypothetical protein
VMPVASRSGTKAAASRWTNIDKQTEQPEKKTGAPHFPGEKQGERLRQP